MRLTTSDYPSAFWLWNDHLDSGRIASGVDRMADWGLRSFIIHPLPDDFRREDFFGAMTTPYLSAEFFETVRVAVERAAVRGMEVWLYDEGGWPSGRASHVMLERWPHLRAQVLTPEGPEDTVPERTDLLNSETTERFISITHEGYRAVVGKFFGNVIPGFFTDEPDVPGQVGTGRLPWTADLPAEFEKQTGRTFEPLLPFFFGKGRDAKARQARVDFAEVWTRLFAERYFDPIRAFCHRHGMVSVGHLLGDQSLRAHARCSGHFFRQIECLDEPGIDVIWGQVDRWKPRSFFPSFASSAIRRPGQRCWSESFAAYGHGLTIQEMKAVADHQLVQGINKFAPMQMLLSRRGARWIQTGTRPLEHAPDADHYPAFEHYLAGAGKRLREGTLFRPVEAPYPIEELWADYGRAASSRFNRLAGMLSDRNIGFVFSPSAKEKPFETLAREFDSRWPYTQKVHASRGIRWIAFDSKEGQPWIFCVNGGSRSASIRFEPIHLSWKLAAGESRFLSLSDPHPDPQMRTVQTLDEWELAPATAWHLTKDGPEPETLSGLDWQKAPPGAWSGALRKDFSGTVRYRTRFAWNKPHPEVTLDLGRVHFAVSVTINGQCAGSAAWAPFCFEIGALLQSGTNELELSIDGSLANLMHALETRDELVRRGWWNVYLERALELEKQRLDSGLHGPVRLRVASASGQSTAKTGHGSL